MSLDEDFRRLSRIPMFSALEPEALRLIAFSAETRILRAGDILFRRGETSDCGYIVLSGSIALDATAGGEPARLVIRRNGLVGDLALIIETGRPATAIAREPSTVLKVPRTLFHRVLQEFPRSAERIRLGMTERLSEFVDELAGFAGRNGR